MFGTFILNNGERRWPVAEESRRVQKKRRSIFCETRETLSHLISISEISMPVQWRKDIDPALADARARQRPALLDFSAAPM
jgi:hypothetical protein